VVELITPLEQKHHLPALPYPHHALEPYIDTRTMQLHHGEHHARYVEELNRALAPFPDLQGRFGAGREDARRARLVLQQHQRELQ
jgi:superoxide dismutase